MSIDYDNIDDLLKIYYDLQNDRDKNKYEFKTISQKDIKLSDLKKPNDFDYMPIFKNATIKFLNSYNDTYNYVRKSNDTKCILSFGTYSNNEIDNISSKIMNNVKTHYIMSENIFNENFKHTIFPIMMFSVKYEDIKDYVPELKIKKNIYCFITEYNEDLMTLEKYIKKNNLNETDWKIILFQIIYTLNKLYESIVPFCHGKLDLSSILISKNTGQTEYTLGLTKYVLPQHDFSIKITNFQEEKDISNDYYDINYFMNYLYLWIDENKDDNIVVIPDNIKKFILEAIPKKITNIKSKDFKGNNFENVDMYIDNSKTSPKMILKKNNLFSNFIDTNTQSRPIIQTYLSPIMSRQKKKIDYTNNIMPSKTKKNNKNIEKSKTKSKMVGKIQNSRLSKKNSNKASNKISRSTIDTESASSASSVSSVSSVSSNNFSDMRNIARNNNNFELDSEPEVAMSRFNDDTVKPDYNHYLHNLKDKKDKKDKKSKKSKKNKHKNNDGLENYLGEKAYGRIRSLPDNYMEVLPHHLVHKLEQEYNGSTNNVFSSMFGIYEPVVNSNMNPEQMMTNSNPIVNSNINPEQMMANTNLAEMMANPMANPMANSMVNPMVNPEPNLNEMMINSNPQQLPFNQMGGKSNKKYKLVPKNKFFF